MRPAGITGINAGHALAGDVLHFWDIGGSDTDLVSGDAISTTAALVTDPDLGGCRRFSSGADAIATGWASSGAGSVVFILRPEVSYNAGGSGLLTLLNITASGHISKLWYNAYSSYRRWEHTLRGYWGATVVTPGGQFASNEALQVAQVVGAAWDVAGTQLLARDGLIDGEAAGGSNAWNLGTAFTLMPDPKGVLVSAVIAFGRRLSDAELQAITDDPWALADVGGGGGGGGGTHHEVTAHPGWEISAAPGLAAAMRARPSLPGAVEAVTGPSVAASVGLLAVIGAGSERQTALPVAVAVAGLPAVAGWDRATAPRLSVSASMAGAVLPASEAAAGYTFLEVAPEGGINPHLLALERVTPLYSLGRETVAYELELIGA